MRELFTHPTIGRDDGWSTLEDTDAVYADRIEREIDLDLRCASYSWSTGNAYCGRPPLWDLAEEILGRVAG